ncbi:hypothetical protein [Pseudomonas putida]
MNTEDLQEYRARLVDYIDTLELQKLAPMSFHGADGTRATRPIPSAIGRDVALVVEDEMMAVKQGLSSEQLEGIMLCTHLANLVASEHHQIESRNWQSAYYETMKSLGWRPWAFQAVTRYYNEGTSLEQLAHCLAKLLKCDEVNPLLARSHALLQTQPTPYGLFKNSNRRPDGAFYFRCMPVPAPMKMGGDLMVGVVTVQDERSPDKNGRFPAPAPLDALARGFSVHLEPKRFDVMMSIVEPALSEITRRKFEEIRLG